MNRLRRTCAAS